MNFRNSSEVFASDGKAVMLWKKESLEAWGYRPILTKEMLFLLIAFLIIEIQRDSVNLNTQEILSYQC